MADTTTKTKTDAKMRVTMPDGSKWDVPVQLIADNRDDFYGEDEDTVKFVRDGGLLADEISDWAANNMDWADVEAHAVKVQDARRPDYDDGWANGDKRIVGKI